MVAFVGQNHSLMHVHTGLAIYVLFQLVWGTRRGSFPALGCVALFEAFNEICDRFYFDSWRAADTFTDVLLTLFWPTVLVVVSHFRRWRWNAPRRRSSKVPRPAADGLVAGSDLTSSSWATRRPR
ncbi:hypothetical protein [Novosphingobium sp. NBM11]|uniref:hypothetical protein n=1 Tax=Novosphingobium sp. NBM11 TaxID=2596914 RepID=UPI0018926BA6|nr:hypothetical protein [Novosphingobium sp. NBM11]